VKQYIEWGNKWKACQLCEISKCKQNRKVIGSGNLAASILAIGEAPGPVERALGEPFAGRSGRFLDTACTEAGGIIRHVEWYTTNTIACFPRTLESANDFRIPSNVELRNCSPRIWELMDMMLAKNLKGVLLIGKTADGFYSGGIPDAFPGVPLTIASIEHPASLLRKGIHYRATEESAVEAWRNYIEEIKNFQRIATA